MKRLFLVCLYVLATIFISDAIAFEHNVPADFNSNDPLTLKVRMPDQGDYQVKCFYRFNNEEEYRVTNLEFVANRLYQVKIPVTNSVNNVDYYFWVYKYNKFLSTLPESNPVSQPYSVLNTLAELVFFEVLSPDLEQKLVNVNDVTLMIRSNFDSTVKLKSAVFNDDEPLSIIRQRGAITLMKNTFPLRSGKNWLTLVGQRRDGSLVKQTIRFKTKKQRKDAKVKEGEIRLNHLAYDTDKESTGFRESFEMTYLAKYKIDYDLFNFSMYGLYDNRDSDYVQPYSRYNAVIEDPASRFKLHVGDVNQRYTPLTLNSRRVRGVKTDVDLLKLFGSRNRLTLSVIAGQTNEAIEVSSGNVTAGTFEQETVGAQVLLSTLKLKSSVQYFKVYDINDSLTSGNIGTTKPVENHLLGAFFQYRPTSLSLIENEFVGGAYYSDKRAVTVNIDELNLDENLQSIIESTLPLKTSLTAGNVNKFVTQFPLFSRYRIFKFTHEYVHPSFVNILNSSIESDKQQVTFDLSQKLLNRKLALNGQYKQKANNILSTLGTTTSVKGYRIGANYRTQRTGVINSSFMLTRRDQEVSTDNATIDNQLNYVLLGWTGIPVKNKGRNVYFNFNFSLSEYIDYLSSNNNTDTVSYAINMNSSYKTFKLVFGVNKSDVTSILSGTTNYLTINSTVRRNFLETVALLMKVKLIFGVNTTVGYEQNSTKLISSWDYSFKRKDWFSFKEAAFYYGFDYTVMADVKDSEDTSLNFYETYFRFKVINSF